jgi:hypothetical protein
MNWKRLLLYASRFVSVLIGYVIALDFSHHDDWSWYGPSHGDDPLALAVWFIIAGALWYVVERVHGRMGTR